MVTYMTPLPARTVNDDLKSVEKKGITIVSDEEAQRLMGKNEIRHFTFGDILPSGIQKLLKELGVGWKFSHVAGAVQDHGVCPAGVTSLDFRHQFMKERIEQNPFPEHFLLSHEEIPDYLTRMRATGELLSEIPAPKLFMMDTGMAAIIGASLDPYLRGCDHCIIVDIGNSHTLGAVLTKGLIGGFFEYHTNGLTPQRMEELLINLGNGTLDHRSIIAEGGHGAYIRSVPGYNKIEKIVATGPRRKEIMGGINLEYIEGAPLGDNMMTGTAGLLESIKRREKLLFRWSI